MFNPQIDKKPKFDPNQKFTPATDESAKPAFDPNKSFEEVKKKEAGAISGESSGVFKEPPKIDIPGFDFNNPAGQPTTPVVAQDPIIRINDAKQAYDKKTITPEQVDILQKSNYVTDLSLYNLATPHQKQLFAMVHNAPKMSDVAKSVEDVLSQYETHFTNPSQITSADLVMARNSIVDKLNQQKEALSQSAGWGGFNILPEHPKNIIPINNEIKRVNQVFADYIDAMNTKNKLEIYDPSTMEALGVHADESLKQLGQEREKLNIGNNSFKERELIAGVEGKQRNKILQQIINSDLPESFKKNAEETLNRNYLASENVNYDREKTGLQMSVNTLQLEFNDLAEKALTTNPELADAANKKLNDLSFYLQRYNNIDDRPEYRDVRISKTAKFIGDEYSKNNNTMTPISSQQVREIAVGIEKDNPGFIAKYGSDIDYLQAHTNMIPLAGFPGGVKAGLYDIGENIASGFGIGEDKIAKAARHISDQYNTAIKGTGFTEPTRIVLDKNDNAYKELANEHYGSINFNSASRFLGKSMPALAEFILMDKGLTKAAGLVNTLGVKGLIDLSEVAASMRGVEISAEELAAAKQALTIGETTKGSLGLFGTLALQGHDQNRKIADDLIDDNSSTGEAKKTILANALNLSSFGAFKLLGITPSSVVEKVFQKAISKDALDLFEKNGWNITADQTENWFKNSVIPTAKAVLSTAGQSAVQGAKLGGAIVLDENTRALIGSIANPDKSQFPSLKDDGNIIMQQVLLMTVAGLPSLVGAGFSPTTKDVLYDAGLKAPQQIDKINKMIDSGEIDQLKGNGMISMVNTMAEQVSKVQSLTNDKGLPLTIKQKRDIAVENFRKIAAEKLKTDGHDVNSDAITTEANATIGAIKTDNRFSDASNDPLIKMMSGTEKIFTDFDGTIFQDGKLTTLGEQMKAKVAAGEDVTVLTAREATPENLKFISEQLGIAQEKIIAGLTPEGKAAELAKQSGAKVFYDNNPDNIAAAKNTDARVVNTAEAPQQTSEELFNEIYDKSKGSGHQQVLETAKNNNDIQGGIQYAIDKAGEDPIAFESQFGKTLTNKLIEKIPTEKLNADYQALAAIDPQQPSAIHLKEIITQREQPLKSTSVVGDVEKHNADIEKQKQKVIDEHNKEVERLKKEEIKPEVPKATELFNEKRSIKDKNGQDINIGDVVILKRGISVSGSVNETRNIITGFNSDGSAISSPIDNDGNIKRNIVSTIDNGEGVLDSKWKAVYPNGEQINIGDRVRADVPKHQFEIYNKDLIVSGFNIDGGVSIKTMDGKRSGTVSSKILSKIEGEGTSIDNSKKIKELEQQRDAKLLALENQKKELPQPKSTSVVTPEGKQLTFNGVKRSNAKMVYKQVHEIDEPTDARGAALKYIAGGGKINEADFNKEVSGSAKKATLNTGAKEKITSEAKGKDFVDKNGLFVKEIAHSIWDNLPEHLQSKISDQDIRNELIDVANSHNTRLEAANTYIDSYGIEKTLTDKEQKYYDSRVPSEEEALMAWLESESERTYENNVYSPTDEEINHLIDNYEAGNEAQTSATTPAGKTEGGQKNSSTNSVERNKSQSEERLKTAQSNFNNAVKELNAAENKISQKQSTQSKIFSASQKEMFGVKRDEAKSILDPLRQKIKEAKNELDAAQNEFDNIGEQPKLFSELPPPEQNPEFQKAQADLELQRQQEVDPTAAIAEVHKKYDAKQQALKEQFTPKNETVASAQNIKPRIRVFIDNEGQPHIRVTADGAPPQTPESGATGTAEPRDITSIQNSIVDEERKVRGYPVAMEAAQKEFGTTWDEANKKIEQGYEPKDLIKELKSKPRPLSDVENAILLREQILTQNEYDKANQLLNDAKASGDEATVQEQFTRLAPLVDRLQDIYDVGRAAGTENARGLVTRKMLAKEDFTLSSMMVQKRAANGGEKLSFETEQEIRDLHKKIDRLQQDYDDYVKATDERDSRRAADAAIKDMKSKAGTTKTSAGRENIKRAFDKKVDDAAAKLIDKLTPKSTKGLNKQGIGIEEIVKGAAAIIKAAHSAGTDIKAAIEKAVDYVKKNWDTAWGDFPEKDMRDNFSIEPDTKISDSNASDVRAIALEHIKSNPQIELDALVSAVQADLKEFFPTITEREVRDAISGYGRATKKITKDEATLQLNELQKQAKLVSKLEDLQAENPLPPGKERTAQSEKLKELQKQIEALVKEKGLDEPARLAALKTRIENQIQDYKVRLSKGEFDAKAARLQPKMDNEAIKLQAELQRAKNSFRAGMEKDRQAKRSLYAKTLDGFVKWERAFKLSSLAIIGKLTAAAMYRIVSAPIEEAVGGVVWSRILPRQIVDRAYREAGFNVRAEAKAISDGFMKGIGVDFLQVLKTGKSDLDVLFGKWSLPPEAAEFFGQLHSSLKTVPKRAEFARSFEKRIANKIKDGITIDAMVELQTAVEAYKDANRAIFLQDNFVSDAYTRMVNALEQSKSHPDAGKFAAAGLKFLIPFTKIATNIVGETVTYSAGSVIGAGKLALVMRKGLDNVTPEQADSIMRNFKKGSFGIALMVIGYLNPQAVGGYYQPGEKRKKGDIAPGSVKIFGVEIPKWLLHNPLLETLQLGATIRRVQDTYVKKDGTTKGIGEGAIAASFGLVEENPFVGEAIRVDKMFASKAERNYFLGELAKGTVDPAIVQEIANWTDTDWSGGVFSKPTPRKEKTIMEHVKSGLPGLRQTLEKK